MDIDFKLIFYGLLGLYALYKFMKGNSDQTTKKPVPRQNNPQPAQVHKSEKPKAITPKSIIKKPVQQKPAAPKPLKPATSKQPNTASPKSLEELIKVFTAEEKIPEKKAPLENAESSFDKFTPTVVDEEEIGIERSKKGIHSVLEAGDVEGDGHFDAYDYERARENKYAAMLKNPATVKDAVVLNEILTRKY